MFIEHLHRFLKILQEEKDEINYLISRNNLRRYEYEERYKEIEQSIRQAEENIEQEKRKIHE